MMKTILRLTYIVIIGTTWIRADEPPVAVVPSLPASVYFLSEPREGGKPGVTYFSTISRGPMTATPVFSSREAADSYRATLAPAQARKLNPVVLPKSFMDGCLKHGDNLLLDPTSEAQGGTPLLSESPPGKTAKDNEELQRLFEEDQSDRMPADGKAIDWQIVGPRDLARESRIKELYRGAQLKTGADYFHAAMVLQHGRSPEDYLLCHELCVVAIGKGEENAKWLAAASEDRFLMSIERPQRFGTQSRADGPGASMRLYQVGEGVTDELRSELNVPPLAPAKAKETKTDQGSNALKKSP